MMRAVFTLALLLGFAAPAVAQKDDGGDAKRTSFDVTLEEAYKKEFAFLVGQQRQLEQRLAAVEERNAREQKKLNSEMASLENRMISLDGQIEDAKLTLQEVERSAQDSTDDQQLIRATLEQAAQSLSDYDVSLAIPEDDAALADATIEVFEAASSTLTKLSTVRRIDGQEFFLADGRKVTGTVVHLGRIAAYGVSDEGAGALAPAGGGKLKVWKDDAVSVAKELAAQKNPDTLGIFLYESLNTAVEADVEESLVEHVAAGGAIAWVIVMLGLVGVLLAGLRAVILYTCSGSAEELEAKVGGSARAREADEVIAKTKAIKGSAARVTKSVFRSIREGTDRLDEAISEGLIAEGRRLQLFGTAILVIAAVSPLLGLLGTVTGMISTFDVITKFGTGDPKMLSGGISTALITTELGLIVAIPTLLLGNLLKGWADRIEAEAERAAIRMVTLYTGRPVTVSPKPIHDEPTVDMSSPLPSTE